MSASDRLALIEEAVEYRFASNGDTEVHVAVAGDSLKPEGIATGFVRAGPFSLELLIQDAGHRPSV